MTSFGSPLGAGLMLASALLLWPVARDGRAGGAEGARRNPWRGGRQTFAGSAGAEPDGIKADEVESTAALPVPVVLALVCAALEAGLPTTAALQVALTVSRGPGAGEPAHPLLSAAPGRRAASAPPQWAATARALDLADRTGASAAALLRAAARDERARRRRSARLRAAGLGVRLVVPLGLAVLPAFVLLGVAPVVLGLAASVLEPP